MAENAAIQDWELLDSPVSTRISGNPLSPDDREVFQSIDGGSGAIKLDYFALDSSKPLPTTIALSSDEEREEGGVDSDNPSSADPGSDSMVGFAGSGGNRNGFCSGESSDSEKSELGEVGFEGIRVTEGGLGSDEEIGDGGGGGGGSDGESAGGGERKGLVWWKSSFELLKFWVLRVRPVWSLSVAAAILGVVMLGRRLYRMKQKARRVPHRIIFDDKKASQFMIRAARLNNAFSVVRRVPIIRPGGSVTTPWPVLSLR